MCLNNLGDFYVVAGFAFFQILFSDKVKSFLFLFMKLEILVREFKVACQRAWVEEKEVSNFAKKYSLNVFFHFFFFNREGWIFYSFMWKMSCYGENFFWIMTQNKLRSLVSYVIIY